MNNHSPETTIKSRPLPQDISRILSWWGVFGSLAVVIVICSLLGEGGRLVATAVLFVALFMLPFSLIALYIYNRIDRLRRQSFVIVLEYLDQTIRLNLPLPVMLKAAGVGESGWVGRVLKQVGRDIEEGKSIAQSIEEHCEQVPTRIIKTLKIAERNGNFEKVLPWLIQSEKQRNTTQNLRRNISNAYLHLVLWICLILMCLMSTLIMPKIGKVFLEYEGTPPPITLWGAWFGRWLGGGAYVNQIVPGIAWLALLTILLGMLRVPSIHGWIVHRLFHLPVIGRLFENRQLADVNFMIARGIETGLPAHVAVQELKQHDLTPALQSKIGSWATKLESGSSLYQAAAESQLPPVMVNLLAGTESTSDSVATFDFISSYYGSKFSRVWLMTQSVSGPLLVLGIGVVVGLFAYSLFGSLIALIWQSVITSGTY